MKEKDLITSIKTVLNSPYIGDDCAYLKDLGIVVTQDSLVQDVHFSLQYMTPQQLGYKSVMVNVSDIAASGGECKYLTISLSLPKNLGLFYYGEDSYGKQITDVEKFFIEEFYDGAKAACGKDIQIVGGDITGSDKVYISVCAIGTAEGRNISSRSNAKVGYKVVVAGEHGSSATGLYLLQRRMGDLIPCSVAERSIFIQSHLEPKAQVEFGANVGKTVKEDYAMMDTSDGLMEALSTIANESGVLLEIDFDKIPHEKSIENFENWEDLVLFGGEDYGIVAVVPQKYDIGGVEIGQVKLGLGVDLKIKNTLKHYSKGDVEKKLFNHFDY